MNLTGIMQTRSDGRGVVRVEDVFDTGIDDLWEACTTAERLSRWIAHVSGDLQVGNTVHAVFTSSWSGPVRIDACDAPQHLLVTSEPGTEDETQTEAWLTAEGSRTRLVVEERGLPTNVLHFHAAGWQVHLEDLTRALALNSTAHPQSWSAEQPAAAWHERWSELTPLYDEQSVD